MKYNSVKSGAREFHRARPDFFGVALIPGDELFIHHCSVDLTHITVHGSFGFLCDVIGDTLHIHLYNGKEHD